MLYGTDKKVLLLCPRRLFGMQAHVWPYMAPAVFELVCAVQQPVYEGEEEACLMYTCCCSQEVHIVLVMSFRNERNAWHISLAHWCWTRICWTCSLCCLCHCLNAKTIGQNFFDQHSHAPTSTSLSQLQCTECMHVGRLERSASRSA